MFMKILPRVYRIRESIRKKYILHEKKKFSRTVLFIGMHPFRGFFVFLRNKRNSPGQDWWRIASRVPGTWPPHYLSL